jgi:hypothetical protein
MERPNVPVPARLRPCSGAGDIGPALDRCDLVLDAQPNALQLLHFMLSSGSLAIVDQAIQPAVLLLQGFEIIVHDILLPAVNRPNRNIELIERKLDYQYKLSIK